MYITKNGINDLVVLSDEAYDNIIKLNIETQEERIDRLVSENFEKHFNSLKEYLAYHLTYNLKYPLIARKFYKKVLKSLVTMGYSHKRFLIIHINTIAYIKCFVDKYIIIYKVFRNIWTNLNFTYISWYSNLL